MGLEVALLESDPDRGVRILGRTTELVLVEAVRDHLIDRLGSNGPKRKLSVVPNPGVDAGSEIETSVDPGEG